MAVAPLPALPPWPRLRVAAKAAVSQARARAVAWRLHAAVPGLAGAALISAGCALVWLPLGLVVAGAFCLRADSRL